ncbi:ATP dependent DNA ligase [Rhizoctonia solani]|uniref:ATP dependent DNA ligase n=1 Tax=Rhizoctonia solani TaxID=456999 RepID=A0A8H7ILQ0_9AGAM|nr:ATP dependent DNA ligase [Rhizoctonia solani]
MNTRMCRGYLGVFGPKIDEIANEYTQSLMDQYGDTNPQLKRGDALEKTNTSPVIYGLGTNRNGVYWVTVAWALGQRFRAQLGLPPKQFHITLTSVDEHEIDKGPSSVIWVHPSLAIVETILGHDSIDSASSSQTEFLASFIHGLLAQYEFTLAQSAAELLVMSEPTNPRGFVCLGDVSVRRDHWKLAMLCFGSALGLYVCDPTKTDLKTDRISSYCLKQLRRSAEFTDWGTIFMVTGLLNDETLSLPALASTSEAISATYLRGSDSIQLPKRTSNSRTRVLTLVPHKPKSTVTSTNDAKDIPSPHVNDIVNVVASLDIGKHALSTTPDLELFPRSLAKGPISTYVRYRLPRFFGWIVPFYMALMSTPRNADDIATLASPNIGIRHILTLTEETPLPDTWFRQVAVARVRHTYVPIPNYKPPTIEQMDIILRRIHEPGGSPVLIHCGGGKGRAANAAIAAIRLIRSGSIETAHQEGFVETWVSALWKRNKLLLPRTLEPHPTPLLIEGSVNLGADLLVLCGLPGSGKSWFSQAVVRRGGFLGKDSEVHVVQVVRGELFPKMSSRAVLDRCNPTSEERRLWIKLASWAQHPIVVWFDYKPQLCIDRAQDRESHPTLTPGPRVLTAVTSMNRSFQPPSEWKLEGFRGFAHITSFEAAIDLCKIVCPAEILKFPRTAHILDLGAATSDDVMEKSSSSTPILIRAGELVVITEKIDGANLGFSLSPLRELRVQNRSHYVNSHDHPQFRKLDSWISSHRQDLYTILDRDDAFPERYILYGEWMAATHSISYSKLGDLFYAFDLFDRATNTFASRRALEATLINTNIQLTPIICTDKAIPANDTLAKMVQQESRFYPGPMEGIYLKVETELAVRQRGKVVRADFITGNEHWGREEMRWNTVLRLS